MLEVQPMGQMRHAASRGTKARRSTADITEATWEAEVKQARAAFTELAEDGRGVGTAQSASQGEGHDEEAKKQSAQANNVIAEAFKSLGRLFGLVKDEPQVAPQVQATPVEEAPVKSAEEDPEVGEDLAAAIRAKREAEAEDKPKSESDSFAVHYVDLHGQRTALHEACDIRGKTTPGMEPKQVLEMLRVCTKAVEDFAVKTKWGHRASKEANEAYVREYKTIVGLLLKLKDIDKLHAALEQDRAKAAKYLLGMAGNVETNIGNLLMHGGAKELSAARMDTPRSEAMTRPTMETNILPEVLETDDKGPGHSDERGLPYRPEPEVVETDDKGSDHSDERELPYRPEPEVMETEARGRTVPEVATPASKVTETEERGPTVPEVATPASKVAETEAKGHHAQGEERHGPAAEHRGQPEQKAEEANDEAAHHEKAHHGEAPHEGAHHGKAHHEKAHHEKAPHEGAPQEEARREEAHREGAHHEKAHREKAPHEGAPHEEAHREEAHREDHADKTHYPESLISKPIYCIMEEGTSVMLKLRTKEGGTWVWDVYKDSHIDASLAREKNDEPEALGSFTFKHLEEHAHPAHPEFEVIYAASHLTTDGLDEYGLNGMSMVKFDMDKTDNAMLSVIWRGPDNAEVVCEALDGPLDDDDPS